LLVRYQLLNFNPLGSGKYDSLDANNAFASARPFSEEQMAVFGEWLADIPVSVKVGD
jgi:hypothetical protein